MDIEIEQILTLIDYLALGHMVAFAPRQHIGQRALARPVGAHDGMDLAGANLKIDTAQDLLAVDSGVKVLDG